MDPIEGSKSPQPQPIRAEVEPFGKPGPQTFECELTLVESARAGRVLKSKEGLAFGGDE